MWWKIYFWIYGILTVIGLLVYANLPSWTVGAWVEVITSILAVVGLFSFVYRKKIFQPVYWKVFFWAIIISWVFNLVYVFTPLEEAFELPKQLQSAVISSQTELVVGIIISLPLAYAMYLLGNNTKVSVVKAHSSKSKKRKK